MLTYFACEKQSHSQQQISVTWPDSGLAAINNNIIVWAYSTVSNIVWHFWKCVQRWEVWMPPTSFPHLETHESGLFTISKHCSGRMEISTVQSWTMNVFHNLKNNKTSKCICVKTPSCSFIYSLSGKLVALFHSSVCPPGASQSSPRLTSL